MKTTNSEQKVFGQRLKKLESLLELTPLEMAENGGCSRATYYRYRSGEAVPDLIFFDKILKYEKSINVEWLLIGEGAPLKSTPSSGEIANEKLIVEPSGPELYNFPLYRMDSIHNGEQGQLSINEWKDTEEIFYISKNLLESFPADRDLRNAFAMTVEGDSMDPEVKSGSLVFVDKNQAVPYNDGIFIVRYDQFLRMKLVQPLPGEKLLLSTINKRFESITVDKDQKDFEILGRIVCSTNLL